MGPDPTVLKAIQRLWARVAREVPLERIILFGSRARGDAGPYSDVDLLVVSPAFAGKNVSERAAPLYHAWDLDLPVDFLCYAPDEFDRLRRRVSLVRIAIEEGVEVAA